jgi:hypothetical protein
MRYDGYFGGHDYSSSLDRPVSIGWVSSEPGIDIREEVKVHQERFNLARSVFVFFPELIELMQTRYELRLTQLRSAA